MTVPPGFRQSEGPTLAVENRIRVLYYMFAFYVFRWVELEQADDLPADVRRPLAEHIRALADDVEHAVVIEGSS